MKNLEKLIVPITERLEAQDRADLHISRFTGAEKMLLLKGLVEKTSRSFVLVAPDRKDAEKMVTDLGFFMNGRLDQCAYMPPLNILPFKTLSSHNDASAERMRILNLMATGDMPRIIVTTAETLVQKVVPKKELIDYSDILMINEDIDLNALVSRFIAGGYTRATIVEEPGDFSVRGGIVDFFCPMYPNPVRIELFGDTIESIRFFSVTNQRKIDSLTEVVVVPAKEAIVLRENMDDIVKRVRMQAGILGLPVSKVRGIVETIMGDSGSNEFENLLSLVYPRLDCFFDYVPKQAVFVFSGPAEIRKGIFAFRDKARQNFESAVQAKKLAVDPDDLYLTLDEAESRLSEFRKMTFREFAAGVSSGKTDIHSFNFNIEENRTVSSELKNRSGQENLLGPLVRWIDDRKTKGFMILMVCSTRSQAERLKELIAPYGIDPGMSEHFPEKERGSGLVFICTGLVSCGFVWPELHLAVITEDEIFGAKRRIARNPSRVKGKEFLSFGELKEGDFIVHSEHGIGRYEGLAKICLNGVTGDYLHIGYKDDDKLYLPVERMGCIQKYVGVDGYTPVLDKMGGKSWDKVKEKAKREVEKMAGELLKLYAERKVRGGHAFSQSDSYFKDFEAGFEYEETPGQIAAIHDVIKDMEGDTPMDRLVCGDVGYGKTEVALRAAFKAIHDGKQAAVLVPTTVLAEQHLKTFSERFSRYPVRVEGLSRFKTKGRQKEIVEDLAVGKVDVVIGTHRLLSEDIRFRDLGLVIVDEEQRFGVKHKEKLKKLRNTVDVLTLTATPIPRTLHMAMTGIRDISVIATPPEQRQAIMTYVSEFDDGIVADAIRKELSRNGQIFFVHNDVQSIEKINEHLKKLVPEVRTAIAHGQMKEGDLEKAMMLFVDREIDMLVCTTIIESGLDIPAANTMFINRADRFGLSQMYQLRGRIGRSEEQAYAYLFIPEDSSLSRDARKRLRVLMEYSDLGAGFQIAMSDLQIRGGGAALGASQSGHIAAVGYEMFLDLMEHAMADIKGEHQEDELEPEINISLSSYFSEEFIPAIDQRLMLYKRLSGVTELRELTDIKEELTDRYGDIPEEAQNILLKIMLKVMAVKAGIKRLDISTQQMQVYFSERHQKNPQNIINLVIPHPDRYDLSPEGVLKVKLPKGNIAMAVSQSKKVLKEIAQHVNG